VKSLFLGFGFFPLTVIIPDTGLTRQYQSIRGDVEDWPSAGASLSRIRQIIAVNLPLGLLVVVIGASGRYWG